MRIFVTGIGIVSPLGCGSEAAWQGLVEGSCAIGRLSLFELPGCRVDIAAQVPDLRVADVAPAAELARWSRTDAMAVIAAREALHQAGDPATGDVALIVGGTTAGMLESERELARLTKDPGGPFDRQQMHSHPLTAPTDRVHRACGSFDSTLTLCSACSGGANAVLLGAAMLRNHSAEIVLAGGADALCRLTYSGFAALGALAAEPCRPFDRHRTGLSLGEGAAFLVLEAESSARRRSVEPIAELCGWAVAAEAHHPTHPEPSGEVASWVMKRAMARAGLTAAELDYVNAHGTGTPHNDGMERRALAACLGAETPRVAVSSTKGHLGHGLGAAGALEAAITTLAVARGVVPPTVGLEQPDADDPLRHVRRAETRTIRAAMSNSFGFGGADTTLLFARPGFAPPDAGDGRRDVVITGGASVGSLGVADMSASAAYGSEISEAPSGLPLPQALPVDPARARRLGRAARLATVATERALRDANLELQGGTQLPGVGILAGSAFGSVGSTGKYLVRLFDKGARFASPALFPGALPSTLSTSPSIYLGLRGPALSTADLTVSAESAVVGAAELIAAGEADAVVATAVEERSAVAERVSSPLCSGIEAGAERGEGAGALVLEDADTARRRHATIRARLVHWTAWRGDPTGPLAKLPPPPPHSAIFRSRAGSGGLPLPAGWDSAPQQVVAAAAGTHEAAGAFALLAAAAAIARGPLRAALVIGEGPDRGYCLLLADSS